MSFPSKNPFATSGDEIASVWLRSAPAARVGVSDVPLAVLARLSKLAQAQPLEALQVVLAM